MSEHTTWKNLSNLHRTHPWRDVWMLQKFRKLQYRALGSREWKAMPPWWGKTTFNALSAKYEVRVAVNPDGSPQMRIA